MSDETAKVSELPHILRCDKCGRLTTRIEAVYRKFRTGSCGHCGGKLYAEPNRGIKEAAR